MGDYERGNKETNHDKKKWEDEIERKGRGYK